MNTTEQQNPTIALEFDAIGIEQLEKILRSKISDYLQTRSRINGRVRKGSFKLLSNESDVSSSYLHDFAKGKSICITNLNKLAHHFDVKYMVTNFAVEKPNK